MLDHPLVQARLHLPPDQFQQRPESRMVRSLYDFPELPVGPEGVLCRVVVATHPTDKKKSPVGVTREGIVYELFFTRLPQQAFTASDVVELYLHRGAFEPALADEDNEQDPDRWCSHSAWGQECWQVVAQWVWNLRLELGHRLEPTPIRTTEFAPAISPQSEQTATRPASSAPATGYGSPTTATSWKTGRFSGQDFPLQPDGTLRCPAGQELRAQERRRARRWQSAHGVCGQYPQLPSLPSARAVPMAGESHRQTASGECAVASIGPRFCSSALEGLEPEGSSPSVPATAARPTPGGTGGVRQCCQPNSLAPAPLPCAAGALSSRLARALRSQCACSDSEPGNDQTLRHPRGLCRLARAGRSLIRRVWYLWIPLLGPACFSE